MIVLVICVNFTIPKNPMIYDDNILNWAFVFYIKKIFSRQDFLALRDQLFLSSKYIQVFHKKLLNISLPRTWQQIQSEIAQFSGIFYDI